MRKRWLHLLLGSALVLAIVGTAHTQPDAGRGGPGKFRINPDDMFKQLAGGADSISVSSIQIPEFMTRFEPADKQKERMNAFLQKKGVTNGVMTRALYSEYFEERMREMRERFGRMREGKEGPPASGSSGSPPSSTPPAGGAEGSSDVETEAREAFRRLDTNGDGVLNEDELQAVRRFSRIYDERERYDTNRNGKIEFEEYLEYFKNRRASRSGRGPDGDRGPRGEDPPARAPVEEEKRPLVYRAGNLPKDLPSWFEQLDTDKDGQVGLYEWKRQGRSVAEFQTIDSNADGFITVEELLRYQKVARKDTTSNGSDNGTATASLSNNGPSAGRAMPRPGGRGGDGDSKDGRRERFSQKRWGRPGR